MLITNGITMQYGSQPLFEDVSVKFGEGNRYGLIGANGCGKSTFMKILAGEIEPTSGNIELDKKFILVQFINDLCEILPFNIVSLIEFFFITEKIFGQISDSMNITELGFQYLTKLLITKFISNGVYVTINFFFILCSNL